MAYKFQLGRARLSGSIIVEEGLESDFATDISSSQDVYAEAHIRAGDEVSSVGDMEAGGQLRGLSDLYIAATSMQVGNAEFGGDVDVTGNVVAGGEFRGDLQYAVSQGTGINTFSFDNSAAQTVSVDTTWLQGQVRGEFTVADTDTVDMHYDSSAGEFSASVKLKSEAGGTISKDSSGLYIANSAISNAKLQNSTISGKALGTNLDGLSAAAAGALNMTAYDGSSAVSDLAVRVDSTSIVINASNELELVDSHAMGLFSAADTNSIDLEYDGAGAFSGSVRLKSEAGGSISVDTNGLYIANSAISNAKLQNSTISGHALGTNLSSMSVAAGSALSMTSYNGSAAVADLAVQVDATSIDINASNQLEVQDSHIYSLLSVTDTNSIDMTHDGSGDFRADLKLASANALAVGATGLDLKSTIAGNRTFSDDVLIQGDLQVDGALTYINTTNLEVEDRLILLAKGDASYTDSAGFEFEWGDSFQTAQVAFDTTAENAFSSSLPIFAPHMKADSFHGELIGASRMDVVGKTDTDTLEAGKINKYTATVAAGSSESVSLPASPELGQKIMFKAGAISDGGSIEISGASGVVIDGVPSIFIESEYAAVTLVYTDTNAWSVF